MPQDKKTELKAALVTIILLSIAYIIYAFISTPRASTAFGHGLGIVGFLLMLATETLYSLRKRTSLIRWGRMSRWLAVHIYMGIVGPYMVLLHTAWHFAGLAGITMLLTIVVVASGFVGRYIYTTVHRSLAGTELREDELLREIQDLGKEIEARLATQPEHIRQAVRQLTEPRPATAAGAGAGVMVARLWDGIVFRWRLRQLFRQLPPVERAVVHELSRMLLVQRALRMQAMALGTARGLLSLWHTIHVPLGMVLFTSAFLHILFALYYSTLSW